jgi:NADPH:quinone reductase-like Zn-dependent oxidoreductase
MATLPQTMRAIEYTRHGGPEVLTYRTDIAVPIPGPCEVLVRVSYAGINPVDCKLRAHKGASFLVPKPKIPGGDFVGEVIAVGSDCVFRKGQKVYALIPVVGTAAGAYADYVVVNQKLLSPVPAGVELEALGGMPLVGLTVLQAFDCLRGELAGKKILIHAGAGGVGSVAIQYASKHLNMKVATTCGPDNLDFVRELGAEIAINYRETRFEDELSGYDAVFDTIEGEYAQRAMEGGVLKPGGDYVSILTGKGGLTDLAWTPVVSKLRQFLGRGPRWSRVLVRPCGRDMMRLTVALESGVVKPVVDKVFPLMHAGDAHRYLEKGHARGKVILDCRDRARAS